MIDIFFGTQGDTTLSQERDQKALASQLGLFLICKTGELKYDLDYGLDYDLLLNHNINDNFKSDQIKTKIKKYFSEKIKNIVNVNVFKIDRTLHLKIKYISIYSEEVQELEI